MNLILICRSFFSLRGKEGSEWVRGAGWDDTCCAPLQVAVDSASDDASFIDIVSKYDLDSA
jgi:hypothetical protein